MPISVVIPTYNRAPIAARTIASVLTSTAFAAILEVIETGLPRWLEYFRAL